jgi:nitrogen fixation NifU-like protein
MNSDFDDFQEQILEDARKIYSETTIDHFMNPRNFGKLEEPNGFAKVTGSCGDSMSIWIRIVDGIVSEISFNTDGCGTSIASASMVTVLAKGKTVGDARKIGQWDVVKALGGLPKESEHCGLLAASALLGAIENFTASNK